MPGTVALLGSATNFLSGIGYLWIWSNLLLRAKRIAGTVDIFETWLFDAEEW